MPTADGLPMNIREPRPRVTQVSLGNSYYYMSLHTSYMGAQTAHALIHRYAKGFPSAHAGLYIHVRSACRM